MHIHRKRDGLLRSMDRIERQYWLDWVNAPSYTPRWLEWLLVIGCALGAIGCFLP